MSYSADGAVAFDAGDMHPQNSRWTLSRSVESTAFHLEHSNTRLVLQITAMTLHGIADVEVDKVIIIR